MEKEKEIENLYFATRKKLNLPDKTQDITLPELVKLLNGTRKLETTAHKIDPKKERKVILVDVREDAEQEVSMIPGLQNFLYSLTRRCKNEDII